MSKSLLFAFCCTALVAANRAVAADSLTVVSAATYAAPLASESIAAAFARDLATTTLAAASLPLPTSLGGTTVSVQDRAGVSRSAAIFFVAPGQVNFQIPPQTAVGAATVTISSGDGNLSTGAIQIMPVAPGLFSANGNGAGVAAAVVVSGQTTSSVFSCGTAAGSCTAAPVALPAILELFGTGIRGNSGLQGVNCIVGGRAVPVQYAGPQGGVGLDQVNVALPSGLAGLGQINVVLTVDGQTSNTVTIDTGGAVPPPVTFYVSPNGNDAWSGALPAPNAAGTDGPFATLPKAQQAVRGRGNAVVLRGGTYTLTQPLAFTAADSSVVWQNYPGETPVISGGKAITGWAPSTAIPGAWQASVAGFAPFEQLWVNGVRRYRVRVPVGGSGSYLHNLGPVYVTTQKGCTNPAVAQGFTPSLLISTGKYECFDRFYFNTGDINPNWSGLADPLHPIEIVDFEDWTIARLRLVSIADATGMTGAPANSGLAYLAGPTAAGTYWGFLAGHRYLIDNVKEFLTSSAAGQWYVDSDPSGHPATITYVPAAGEDFSNSPPVVIAPQVNQLIVSGDPGLDNVTFQGLTFSYSNWVAGSPGYAGFSGSQNSGTEYVPAALSFTRAASITLDSVTLSHLGGWGVEFVGVGNAGSGNQVLNSVITDLGSGAIRIGADPTKTDTDANVAQYTQVYNNLIAGGDRMVPGVAITIENSHHNTIDHNEIYDFYNQGINLGSAQELLYI